MFRELRAPERYGNIPELSSSPGLVPAPETGGEVLLALACGENIDTVCLGNADCRTGIEQDFAMFRELRAPERYGNIPELGVARQGRVPAPETGGEVLLALAWW